VKSISIWFALVFLPLSVVAIVACSPVSPAQKPSPGASPINSSAPSAAATVPAQPVAAAYIIGPGDTLQVFVWRNAELSSTVPVRPDGKISTPLVEDMVAVGKTPSQLARDVEKVLGEYVRSPQVNIIVTQPLSAFSQVKVIGQVLKPQSLPYHEGMTVLDALLTVGGLGPYAAGNRAKVVRMSSGQQTEISVNLGRIIDKGDMTQNIRLQPGDVIVVPETRF
jgi:polysaccharide export outer membrane protein